MSEALVVLTTTEKPEDGERIANLLLERELAACVQVMPQIVSLYRWQGRVERASETLLLIKTTRAAYPAVEATIKQNHSYQTPEIIALPVEYGSDQYLDWLDDAVKSNV